MAANAATIMLTEKGCCKLEKMKTKTEGMEAVYDALIELEPKDEKTTREEERDCSQGTCKNTSSNSRMSPPNHRKPSDKEAREPQEKI